MSRMSVDEFDQLINGVRLSLWRWEAQPAYHEPEEAGPFAHWLASEPDDLAWLAGWHEQVRTATAAGRRYQRVRRMTDPLTDYLAWGLTIAPANIEAGEEIRLLEAHQAIAIGMPEYDFVLVDDQVLARMRFGDGGFSGADRIDDPLELVRHRRWRDQAWQHAVSVGAYASRSP